MPSKAVWQNAFKVLLVIALVMDSLVLYWAYFDYSIQGDFTTTIHFFISLGAVGAVLFGGYTAYVNNVTYYQVFGYAYVGFAFLNFITANKFLQEQAGKLFQKTGSNTATAISTVPNDQYVPLYPIPNSGDASFRLDPSSLSVFYVANGCQVVVAIAMFLVTRQLSAGK